MIHIFALRFHANRLKIASKKTANKSQSVLHIWALWPRLQHDIERRFRRATELTEAARIDDHLA